MPDTLPIILSDMVTSALRPLPRPTVPTPVSGGQGGHDDAGVC